MNPQVRIVDGDRGRDARSRREGKGPPGPGAASPLPRRRVLLVDQHSFMRQAAAQWIRRCPSLEVCGMTGGMAQTFRSVRRLRPDVVVSEILQPVDLGFVRRLHRRHPRLPILVFTFRNAALFSARALAAGASGYLTKDAGGARLVRAIRTVLRR